MCLCFSKGHAAAALYTTLSLSWKVAGSRTLDFLPRSHPYWPLTRRTVGRSQAIPFGTGSLGHGLGLACGLAFSQRFTGRLFRVFRRALRRRLQ